MFLIQNLLKIAQGKKLLAFLCRSDRVANTFILLSVTQGPDVELMRNQIAIWVDPNWIKFDWCMCQRTKLTKRQINQKTKHKNKNKKTKRTREQKIGYLKK